MSDQTNKITNFALKVNPLDCKIYFETVQSHKHMLGFAQESISR